MATATLINENVGGYCPVTNHYLCDDGTYLLVTAKTVWLPAPAIFHQATGTPIPVAPGHIPYGADIFLSDENLRVVDADGNLENGMTPFATFDGNLTHEEALGLIGIVVEEQ